MLLRRHHDKVVQKELKKPAAIEAEASQDLDSLTLKKLQEQAKGLDLKGYSNLSKADLIKLIEGA